MLALPPRINDRRLILGLLIALGIFATIKWVRTTVLEYAQELETLPHLANNSGQSFFPPSKQRCSVDVTDEHDSHPDLCDDFPSADAHPRVHVVLKTGASERDKTKVLLNTLLVCTSAVTIIFDMRDN